MCLQPKRCDVVHAKMLPGEVLRSNRSDERRVRAYRSIVRSRHRAWPSEAVAKYPMSPAPTRSHAADAPFIAGFARFFFFHMEMSLHRLLVFTDTTISSHTTDGTLRAPQTRHLSHAHSPVRGGLYHVLSTQVIHPSPETMRPPRSLDEVGLRLSP